MTTYYVKNGGSNGANGLSDSAAWATMEYGISTMAGGDTLLLRRGDTFTGWLRNPKSGSSGSWTTIDAYGTGDKPIISNGRNLSTTSNWVNQGSNIWRAGSTGSDVTLPIYVGSVTPNYNDDSLLIGWRASSWPPATQVQGYWCYNTVSKYLDMYSTINPASYYTHIEAGTGDQETSGYNYSYIWGSYILVRNIEFKHTTWHWVVGNGAHHVTIEYCDFQASGGAYLTGDGYRDGNAIMTWGNLSDFTVRYCRFDKVYEVALSVQMGTSGGLTQQRFYFYGNIFSECTNCFEVWCGSPGVNTVSDIYFCHNILYNTFYRESISYAKTGNRAVSMSTYQTNPTNCFVVNNIFNKCGRFEGDVNSNYVVVGNSPGDGSDIAGFTWDYNSYFPINPTQTSVCAIQASAKTFAQWQAYDWGGGHYADVHSKSVDPLMVDPENGDFTLQSISTLIDAGIDAGLGLAYEGLGFDIGAFEYSNPAPPTRLCPFRRS
jgi:hypothetical protein